MKFKLIQKFVKIGSHSHRQISSSNKDLNVFITFRSEAIIIELQNGTVNAKGKIKVVFKVGKRSSGRLGMNEFSWRN